MMDFYKQNEKQILIFLLIIVVVIFFILTGIFSFDKNEKTPETFSFVNSIKAEHNFKIGLHEYTGAIIFPTPCYMMSVDAIVRESFPENVTIRFMIEEDKKTEVCAQTVTEKKFRIIFQASKEAVVGATVNNNPIKLEITKETIIE